MPNQKPAYYTAFHGLPGCLPDSEFGPIEIATRRDLVAFVNSTLDSVGFSQRSRRQIDLRRVWQWIQARGCSDKASFTIDCTQPHSRALVEFRALSRAEFEGVGA